MRSIAINDFLVGLGMLFVIEGLLCAGLPQWIKRAMESVAKSSDNLLRITGLASAVCGLLLIWLVRH
jgi:uncharacterized protein YjeT (DUF2065 family)